VVNIWIVFSWVMTSFKPVSGYQRFGGTYRLHVQGRSNYVQEYTASYPIKPHPRLYIVKNSLHSQCASDLDGFFGTTSAKRT
jgi:hypothetical protein